jgi:hypothetical protein
MTKTYKIPVYLDGEYCASLKYKDTVSARDAYQLKADAKEMLEKMVKNANIQVGGDRFMHLAVFVEWSK